MINLSTEQMLKELQERVRDKIPSCIIRYGDGEAIILNSFNDLESLKSVLKRQLGYIPAVEQIEAIRNNLIEAYTGSDIIGIPTSKRIHEQDGYWSRAMGILIENLGATIIDEKQLTSTDFHSHFLDKGYFDQLLSGADTICYVSCRNLDDAFKSRFGIKNIYSCIIAPEIKFTSYSGEGHYPDQFNKIRRWIEKVPIEGNICLVGAGFVGKIYNLWFKQKGGIGIDVGSCFDQWAGFVTRGKDRGKDKINDKYKL